MHFYSLFCKLHTSDRLIILHIDCILVYVVYCFFFVCFLYHSLMNKVAQNTARQKWPAAVRGNGRLLLHAVALAWGRLKWLVAVKELSRTKNRQKKTKKRGKGHLRYFSLSVDTADSFVEELLKRRYHNQYTTTSKCDIYRTIVQGRLKFLTISLCIKYKNTTEKLSDKHKKLNLLRGTARRAVSVETVRNVSN